MFSRTPSTWTVTIFTALSAALTACDMHRNPGTGVDDAVAQVLVWPDTLTLDPFENHAFQAFGRTQAGDSVPVSVRWSASAGAITSGGVYTADTSAADALVTATLISSALSGTSSVKKRRVVQIVISPNPTTVSAGGVRQFTAYGRRNTGDSVSVSVTYSATGGAISGTGAYTAGQTAGTYRAIAKQNGSSLADTSVVTVAAVPVASVTVSPAAPSVQVGQTIQLTATPQDAIGNALSGRVVTWATSNAAVATVNPSGLLTGVGTGSAAITATSEGQSGTAIATVSIVPVASVTVSPATATVQIGQTAQLTATPRDASGNPLAGRVVTWLSSATAVATVNGSGLVTGVAAGAATITATSEGYSGSAAVVVAAPVTNPGAVTNLTVAAVTANSVTLSFTEVTNGAGQAASYDIRWAAGTLSWPSATSVAQGSCSVPVAGTAIGASRSCTVLGLASGTGYQFQLVAFRGTMNVDAVYGGLSNVASGTTTSSLAPVASVVVSPATLSLGVGATQQLTASLRDSIGNVLTGRSIVWTSSNVVVGTVTGSGLVTALLAGGATITATSEGKSGSAALTVTAPTGGTVLLQDDFEDAGFGTRGWYDYASIPTLTDTAHITGSTHALEVRFTAGATNPSWGLARRLFPASPTVYVSYWVKYSANWVGSQQLYHPHEFQILSDLDADYTALANSWMEAYIEQNYQNGGIPRLSIQDSRAINTSYGAPPINLIGITENRSIGGCNGLSETYVVASCFSFPPWYNDKEISAPQVWFKPAPGPGYKGNWNHVEAYFQINSIVGGIGQADGVAQYWFNGTLVIDRHDVMFRTGARPTIKFHQFVMAPYIGDGSPVDQTMWIDNLLVMTAKP